MQAVGVVPGAREQGPRAARRWTRRRAAAIAGVALWAATVPGAAELALAPGFTSRVYVTGEGFDRTPDGSAPGIPITTTLGFDASGTLYLASSGSRYGSAEAAELRRLYRIPPGGARLTPARETDHAYGPPLPNPEIGTVTPTGDVFVTTYDRERRIGVLYRMRDGRPKLLAGGTPPRGTPPLLRQPEGVAVDAAGHVYVADRLQDRVLKLDARGRLLDAAYVSATRARLLALGPAALWVGDDGAAERPWQDGVGRIWRVDPADGRVTRVLEGPHAAGMAVSPEGTLFVAVRQTGALFALTADGRRIGLATFGEDMGPRGLVFAPVSPETRRAGIAGDLFLVTFRLRTWYVNEVIQISGPFGDLLRRPGE